jgi:hypothetical protein
MPSTTVTANKGKVEEGNKYRYEMSLKVHVKPKRIGTEPGDRIPSEYIMGGNGTFIADDTCSNQEFAERLLPEAKRSWETHSAHDLCDVERYELSVNLQPV